MSQNTLQKICADKKEHVIRQKNQRSLADLQDLISGQTAPRGFMAALKAKGFPAIIAEIKKASPSKGLIRADFNPVEIAEIYRFCGAACLSVLTDEPYFQGSDTYFKEVRASSPLPMLRKDFMIDPYQIYESRALGADCVLIIMAALSDSQSVELYDAARGLGMDALIEVHNQEELERALSVLKPALIGVNNRNLKTLEVNIETSVKLASLIPTDVCKVAESGLAGFDELEHLKAHGYNSFLVGESLMRQRDIAAAFRVLTKTT